MDFLKLAWFRIQIRVGITTSEARALVGVAGLLLVGVMVEQVQLHVERRDALVIERAPLLHNVLPSSDEVVGEVSDLWHAQPAADSVVSQTVRDGPIDINSATADELDVLPGIGPALAQRIVTYRERYGAFADVESLVMVPGIGPRTLDRMRTHVAALPD